MPHDIHALVRALMPHHRTFHAFVAARVGSDAEAEDILQEGLAKAVRRAGNLREGEKIVPWFYQLLRHAIIDHYRHKGAERRRDDTLGTTLATLESDVEPPAIWEKQLCTCLEGVVDTLKPAQAALLRRVDLGGESVQDAARALGISANNASVTLHRARQELRSRLEAICGDCADGACLDCDCAD